jgi:hypothetical protein
VGITYEINKAVKFAPSSHQMVTSVYKINQVSKFQFVSDILQFVLELDGREATQPVKGLSEHKRQTKPAER